MTTAMFVESETNTKTCPETISVSESIAAHADVLRDNGIKGDDLGRLTDETVQTLKKTGITRMTQPRDFGGLETHICDYFKAVIEVGALDGNAGWISGVVGVHPHGLAHGHRQLQEELWADDPDTWIASPYAPLGRAKVVDGGYILNGHWGFSSGTDHCTWIVLGGMVVNANDEVIDPLPKHFVLPRQDYEILHDSWEVFGLKGTGSKDIIVKDLFVPTYRVIDTAGLAEGTGGHDPVRHESTLYRLPRNLVFSGIITAGTLGLAKGSLNAFIDWSRGRETRNGRADLDPSQLVAVGAAAADIDASITHVLQDMEAIWDQCDRGEVPSFEDRLRVRRNQLAASHRAVSAADDVFKLSGGGAIHLKHPLQRFWRGAQTALHHASNQTQAVFNGYGLSTFGHEVPAHVRV
jgi:alkylation response protein AidB-like acyl-CoA dehydrogenase